MRTNSSYTIFQVTNNPVRQDDRFFLGVLDASQGGDHCSPYHVDVREANDMGAKGPEPIEIQDLPTQSICGSLENLDGD